MRHGRYKSTVPAALPPDCQSRLARCERGEEQPCSRWRLAWQLHSWRLCRPCFALCLSPPRAFNHWTAPVLHHATQQWLSNGSRVVHIFILLIVMHTAARSNVLATIPWDAQPLLLSVLLQHGNAQGRFGLHSTSGQAHQKAEGG